ncbi:MAG: co-chaperone DjlA [Gammaproteobacteria bacterium]
MAWWGRIVGGAFGFMAGGPLGAALGAALGYSFDKGMGGLEDDQLSPGDKERVQTAFFTATFSVMGHLAKADGRVTPDEIQTAERIMEQMQLAPDQRQAAISLFKQGKEPGFPLDQVLEQFRTECHRRVDLFRMFLEIQLHAAYADGDVHPSERQMLERIRRVLRVSEFDFQRLEALIQAEYGMGGESFHTRGAQRIDPVKEAYSVLGVSKDDDEAVIKRAYRRLISQHHPDKLVAKGLPEEMMKLAAGKTHEIKQAYETIREARGF